VPGGAVDVIGEGWFDDVDAVFGVHCDPKVDVGHVGLRVGPISSAADMIEIRVSGPGGHTSRPERTVDLVAVLARVVGGMQAEIDRLTGEPGAVRCVFGSVHAGDAANVIPSSGSLRGTVRTPDHDVWRHFPKYVEDALAALLGGTGVTWTTEHRRGVPPVVNDEGATSIVANAVRAALGDDGVVEVEQSWGGDCSLVPRQGASAYARLWRPAHRPGHRLDPSGVRRRRARDRARRRRACARGPRGPRPADSGHRDGRSSSLSPCPRARR
jgi:amidohydrolase